MGHRTLDKVIGHGTQDLHHGALELGPGPATNSVRAMGRTSALFVAGPGPGRTMSYVLWHMSCVLCPMSPAKIRHGYDTDTTWILEKANIHEQYKVPWDYT